MQDESLLQTFRSEVSERIASLQAGLLQLEETPDNPDVMNAIFRDAHTIKGSAKMMGFVAIKELAHRMEDVLGDVKDGRLALGPSLADILLHSSDQIVALLDSLDRPDEIPNAARALIRALEEARIRGGSARNTQRLGEAREAKSERAAQVAREQGEENAQLASASAELSGGRSRENMPPETHADLSPESIEIQTADRAAAGGQADRSRDEKIHPRNSEQAKRPWQQRGGREGDEGAAKGEPRRSGSDQTESSSPRAPSSLGETLGAARIAKKIHVRARQLKGSTDSAIAGPSPSDEAAMHESPPAKAGAEAGVSVRSETFVNPIGQSIRIEASKVYELIDQAGEAVIGEVRIEELARRLSDFMRDLEARMRRFRHKQDSNAFLSALEEVRQKVGSISSQLIETVLSQTRSLDRLQEQAMGLAMLPTASIFAPFPRLVRNLSRELSKEVELELDGGGTELDKQVLEQIVDPIRHLLINAVDHGIERPEERLKAGKPRKGTVRVAARQRGRQVVIEVSDDGRGIDPARVREAALKKGLILDADELSESESLSLLFRPGFSTAGWVTDTSGRGVGLDVVKEAVDRLKGTVEVYSKVGEGTTFSITLPITLAIVDVLLVDLGGQDFAIPVASVDEVLSPQDQEVKEVAGTTCVVWRGRSVALFDLHSILGVPGYNESSSPQSRSEAGNAAYISHPNNLSGSGDPTDESGGAGPALILSSGTRRIAARVDALIGQQEVVIKGVGSFLPRIRHIAGASILGDGRVVLVLDPNELIDTARRPGGFGVTSPRRRKLISKTGAAPRRKLLVVDDSLAIREMLRSIFEAAGYDVEIAIDGQDALGILQTSKVDGVVTDVEMPRLDGFSLCEAIRARPDTSELPVIMVTGLEKEEDKRRGLEVGANAYIVKSAFDQSALLDAVRSLVGSA